MTIDLSLVPAPDLIDTLDYEAILASRKAALLALWPEADRPALEATLAIAARAVLAAVPAADRGPFGCDPSEIIAARNLLYACDDLLALIAALRDQGFATRRRDPAQLDWPF